MRSLVLAFVFVWSGVATGVAEKHAKVDSAFHVGLATRVFHPAAARNWRGADAKELRCTIWYPAVTTAVETKQTIGPPDAPLFDAGMAAVHAPIAASLNKFPLVLVSHGSGGSAEQMAWLGTALARAGFIAVAVEHPGNNAKAQLTAEGFVLYWERATDLSEVLDGMLADEEFGPRIDTSRIVATGFSAGGYTVLALAGAQTDISEITDLCDAGKANAADRPDTRHEDRDTAICHVPEMRSLGNIDDVVRAARKTSAESMARSGESFRDARIEAVFAMAPATGFTLTQESLQSIRVPVDIVVGSADRFATPRENADYVRSYIHGARETVLPNVAHYTFLDTCTAEGKEKLPTYCVEDARVNRDAVHEKVAVMAVKFFEQALQMK